MILTTCAACAAPLAHNAPRCVRCHTRYCHATCQHDHWRRGHKQMCKKIHRGGNAEQYNADKKYKEAVAVAVEACAEDTKGQTCYICTQALHWKTKEGLVRGCSCRGTAGFAHVSCLAEQAKILMDEAVENNLDDKAFDARWKRWSRCSLCEQQYHGVVNCALGWACWKTYCSRFGSAENEQLRFNAMKGLAASLASTHTETALAVYIAARAHTNVPESMVGIDDEIAGCLDRLGRYEEAYRLYKKLWEMMTRNPQIFAPDKVLYARCGMASTLLDLGRLGEARSIFREQIPVARRLIGPTHRTTLGLISNLTIAVCSDESTSRDDFVEAITMQEEAVSLLRRVFGDSHPTTRKAKTNLAKAQQDLLRRDLARSAI